jgi:Protein required for attachment to host cells.
MRTSHTWVCVADDHSARFFHCDAPGYMLEPVMGFGVPQNSHAFAGRLAGQLDRAARDSLFRHLVLVGPRPVLDDIEASMAPGTRSLVVGEVDKNLRRASPRELDTHLCHMLKH